MPSQPKKKFYYYRVQISYPSTRILHFISFNKKEIKQWTKDNFSGPDGVFIDDPTITPIKGMCYIDLTQNIVKFD
jgi:hypothetical protein